MSHQIFISGSVVLVEDNERLRSELEDTLKENGFDVRGVDSGAALNRALQERPANVLVLDLNLAEEDGISIGRRIRLTFPEIGILMLTARVMSADKEEGYQSGADVYMTKPARPAELCAAIRNLLRRVTAAPEQSDWVLNKTAMTLTWRHTEVIELSANELRVLSILAMRNNYAEAHELEAVFETQGGDAAANKLKLTVLISRLRSKISPYTGPINPFRSIRNRGYQLCITLRMV
ncbi:MAG: response regulator transcription factor [Betaproteobacteria bacterium]